jgi:hypothetical protein
VPWCCMHAAPQRPASSIPCASSFTCLVCPCRRSLVRCQRHTAVEGTGGRAFFFSGARKGIGLHDASRHGTGGRRAVLAPGMAMRPGMMDGAVVHGARGVRPHSCCCCVRSFQRIPFPPPDQCDRTSGPEGQCLCVSSLLQVMMRPWYFCAPEIAEDPKFWPLVSFPWQRRHICYVRLAVSQ